MRIKSTRKKSHNRKQANINKSIQKRIERGKRMAKKDRGKQLVCRVLFIMGMILIVLILVATVIFYKKGKSDEPVAVNNGRVYIGNREKDIYSLNFEDEEDAVLPEMSWFKESTGMENSERLGLYMNNGGNLVYPVSKRNSDVPEQLSREELQYWSDIYIMIEAGEKKKRGDAENVKDYNVLTSEEYWELSLLCFQAYVILPQSEMCKQYARNAGDAMLTGLEENMNIYQLMENMNRAYGGYISLLCYRDSNYTIGDTCYWISELFYQCYYHCNELNEEEKEHCVLMAYVFLFYGNEAAKNEDNVQHRKELNQNLQIVEEKLTEYGYEVETSK